MTESVITEKVGCAVAVGQLAPHQNYPDKRKEKKETEQSESENAVLDKSMSLHLAKVLLHQKG